MSHLPATLVNGRQRVAWAFLFGGFVVFLSIAIAIPLLLNAYVQNATRLLGVYVSANEGTISIDPETGVPRAALPGEAAQPVQPDDIVLTDATATGLMLVYHPDNDTLLARVQMYSTTVVRVVNADTPRFGFSNRSETLALAVNSGRVRLVVPDDGGTLLSLTVATPHGDVAVESYGEYVVDVNNATTQVTVQQGQVLVSGAGESLRLAGAERAEIARDEPPTGPLAPSRNLVQNGSFDDLWDNWTILAWNIERADQPEGEMDIVALFGELALHVLRNGLGHADVALRQRMDQDVTDFASLALEVDLRIRGQSLPVCGNVGSECPVIIRVEYEDMSGAIQAWQQGFFATGDINPQTAPDICTTCGPPRLEHIRVPPDQIAFYRADIIEDLQLKGMQPPRRINSIMLIASGHGFNVDILNVGLIAEERLESE